MGNSASNKHDSSSQKKERNHSIAEFDYLLDPSICTGKSVKSSSSKLSTECKTPEITSNGSSKILMLKMAKESGSFISKKDILGLANAKGDDGGADALAVVSQSLRGVAPPKTEGDIVHPAKWLWQHPELTLCMDEHGNTYYYNYNTSESTWDPPENLALPRAEITFRVTIPPEAKPGEVFIIEVNETPLEVMCPVGLSPGSILELSNETPLYEAPVEAEQNPIESVLEEQDGTDIDNDNPEIDAVPELPSTVDDDTLWNALAQVAEVEVYSVKSDAELSHTILNEVANGSYFPELIYQVGWAYKFNLLKEAATACYLTGGSFLDSSLYDNCDGTPRYEIAGFVEWLNDLQRQGVELRETIKSGALEDKLAQSTNDYALLERLSLSGDEAKLIEGIVLRKKQVDTDLDNYRSRVMAIVSVDGGPSREALDRVFSLLKGNVQCEEEDELMDNDEMEEEVSNFLQDRHKFVVDILLTVVLLEEELDSLTQRIEEFELKQQQLQNKAQDGEADPNAVELARTTDTEEVVDEEQERLIAQHRVELEAMKAQLLVKKEEQLQILRGSFDRTRALGAWVAEVLAEGVRLASGATEKVVDEEAVKLVEGDILTQQSEEEDALNMKMSFEEQRETQIIDENLAANQRILQHERELEKLKASLADSQEAQSRALKERLAKKRKERASALEDEGKSAVEAEALATQEIALEEEAGLAEIVKEVKSKVDAFIDQSLRDIKEQADAAAERLENSLNAQKSEQQRALMSRLERRRQECKRRIEAEVAAAGSTITSEQKDVMLASQLAKVESAAEAEAALLEAENLAAVRAARGKMVQLVRTEHEKQCERLENELLAQKDKRVKDLKTRLERKKAERAKEIMSASNGATSSTVAVALANEEVSMEEKSELAKIGADIDKAMEEARKGVMENLVEVHQKETARLEEDMKYQEKMQRTNLANRLERQRKAKERALLAEAAATTATEDKSVKEREIKARVESEMREVAKKEEEALQKSLEALKSQQAKESHQLSEELTYKKSSADKRLKERLAQRNSKTAQAATVKSNKSNGESFAYRSETPVLSSIPELAEAVVISEPVDDGSITVDEFLVNNKEEQRSLLTRLDQFVHFEKSVNIAEKQALVKAAPSKQKSEVALSDLAKAAILFDHIAEFMALGLKKTILYETKALKEHASKAKAAHEGAGAPRFSPTDVTYLKNSPFAATSRVAASEKIVERFRRDIGALMDSQAAERRSALADMSKSGSSATQMQATRQEMTDYHSETILSELEKAAITLVGVWIDPTLLAETAAVVSKKHSSKKDSIDASEVEVDEEEEDEEEELFSNTKRRASTVDLHKLKQQETFSTRIIQWFADVLIYLRLYASCPTNMLLYFDQKCSELKSMRTGTGTSLIDLSSDFRTQLQKPMLMLFVLAFQQHVRVDASAKTTVLTTEETAMQAAAQMLQQEYERFQSSSEKVNIDTLFEQTKAQLPGSGTEKEASYMELLGAYKTAVGAFLAKPMLTPAEIAAIKEASTPLSALTPTSSRAGSTKVTEADNRRFKLIEAVSVGTDRLKVELREKYRKIGGSEEMEQRELGQLVIAHQEVVDMVSGNKISLEEINAEGLLAVIEKKAQGEEVPAEDFVVVQREVQKQKQLQRAQKDVQRVLQNASESENKLGVALKIEQAKRQQALHNRLLNKKKKAAM